MNGVYLKGRDGDRANAVLAAAGYNISLLLQWFRRFLRALLLALFRSHPIPRCVRLDRRDRRRPAMLRFPSEPTDEHAFKKLSVKPICLRSTMFARDGDARWMNDMGFYVVRPQPARQPEPVTTSLKGNSNASDHAPCLASPCGRIAQSIG